MPFGKYDSIVVQPPFAFDGNRDFGMLLGLGDYWESTVTEVFVVKLRLRERESIQEAVRRFRKLVEHSGIKKEMRRREFYEKPSDKRRRARRRAERRARMARMPVTA